jgi:hypothetical protein
LACPIPCSVLSRLTSSMCLASGFAATAARTTSFHYSISLPYFFSITGK